jgi:hypothetical protein
MLAHDEGLCVIDVGVLPSGVYFADIHTSAARGSAMFIVRR